MIYVITSGAYSDYTLHGVVSTETPIEQWYQLFCAEFKIPARKFYENLDGWSMRNEYYDLSRAARKRLAEFPHYAFMLWLRKQEEVEVLDYTEFRQEG